MLTDTSSPHQRDDLPSSVQGIRAVSASQSSVRGPLSRGGRAIAAQPASPLSCARGSLPAHQRRGAAAERSVSVKVCTNQDASALAAYHHRRRSLLRDSARPLALRICDLVSRGNERTQRLQNPLRLGRVDAIDLTGEMIGTATVAGRT